MTADRILVINGGSSSIRFGVFCRDDGLRCELTGKVDRIGQCAAHLAFHDAVGGQNGRHRLPRPGYRAAASFLSDWLSQHGVLARINAIGHRVVHGMHHTRPVRITASLLEELKRLTPVDPDHMPGEIGLIETFRRCCPRVLQVACFDTAFHETLPRVARLLPIPRRYYAAGIRRYGFHGLSYAYLMRELERLDPLTASGGRVILAHLGSGASMAAVRDGRCVDTSMAFTPTAGLPMGTRSGDLDPGVLEYIMRTEKLDAGQLRTLVNRDAGLLGLSETSADVRELLAREADDVRAADALAVFCNQTRKWIGSFAAVLGGVDALVFTGGIGENAPLIRARICDGLSFLGIDIDATKNSEGAALISSAAAGVAVRVIRTDEEFMIARSVGAVLDALPAEEQVT